MRISVIIPAWNGRQVLPDCLAALRAQQHADYEVIVIDNGSADGTADYVAEAFPDVQLIRNRQNRGFGGACNAGLRAAGGEMLVLLNQDTAVRPDWLAALEAFADQHPEAGIIGCKAHYQDGRTLQHAGGWVEWPLGIGRHYGHHEPDEGQWDEARPVEFVTGAAMAIRRRTVDQVGYLDETFWPGYFEDVDYCYRARGLGWEVWYCPQAALLHSETTAAPAAWLVIRNLQRGRLRFVLKHMPPDRLLSEFMPAESEYQETFIREQGSTALRLAYLEAITAAPEILRARWQADPALAREVVAALHHLHAHAWGVENHLMEVLAPAEMAVAPGLPDAQLPLLSEYAFFSHRRIIGPIIVRLRRLWHNVASRWALRHVMDQQDAVNRQLAELVRQSNALLRQQTALQQQYQQQQVAFMRGVKQRIMELAEENAHLARRIAEVQQRADAQSGRPIKEP